MTLDPNDPKLTAYALGELDETERAAIEEQLAESEPARAAVESIRRTAALLSEQLAKEPLPALGDAQRRAIEAHLPTPTKKPRLTRFARYSLAASALAAAACLAIVLGAPHWLTNSDTEEVALTELPPIDVFNESPRDGENGQSFGLRADLGPALGESANRTGYPLQRDLGYLDGAGRDHLNGVRVGQSAPGGGGGAITGRLRGSGQGQQGGEPYRVFGLGRGEEDLDSARPSLGAESDGDGSFSQEPPIVYPPPDVWNQLSQRRTAGHRSAGEGQQPEEPSDEELMKRYPVGDLVIPIDSNGDSSLGGGGLGGGGLGRGAGTTASDSPRSVGSTDRGGAANADFDSLMDIVPETIEPESWKGDSREGRPRTASRPKQGRFVVGAGIAGEENKEGERQKADPTKPPRTWIRSPVTPNTSRLMVGDQEELPLKGLQANVRIDGFRARVVLDCYFYNSHDRRLEGTFQLRLPGGASPYYFAFGETAYEAPNLPPEKPVFFNIMDTRRMGTAPGEIFAARRDTWNQPKEARMVQKEKAAHAYRETVRRRVDPALVEWSGAGVFSSRVFPLMPGKLHRIVIGYDVDLAKVGDDFVYRLDLPEVASDLVVDLNVAALPGVTAAVTPDAEPFTANGRAYYRFEQPKERTIAVEFKDPGNLLVHGSDPESGDYFAAAIRPELPTGDQAPAASHAVFLVDTSLSSNPDRYNLYLALVEKILESNRDSLKEFAVLFFNVDTLWWRDGYLPNTPENTAVLFEYARTLSLEGATDLSRALAEATHPSWLGDAEMPKPDLFLLSDGALTWGNDQAYALTEPLRSAGALFAYVTDPTGTDTRVLAHLARASGGAVFPVLSDEAVAKAATAHRFRPWQLEGIELAGTTDLLLAGRPQSIYPGQDLLLVGRGTPEAGGEITLTLERGGERKTVHAKINHIIDSALAPRAYGQVAVGQLEDLADATRDVSVAYARHFRVTGQTCSLLMLESEADYQRFNIKPEEDAFVVKSQPASRIIDRVVEKFRSMLADPKAAFLNWLERLQQMPGMQFNSPTALRLALEQMPESSFDVKSPALACKLRSAADLPEAIRKQLAARDVNYDTATSEAARRFAAAGPADALRALSSLIEGNPGDTALATDVAYSALQWGLPADAFHLFHRVSLRRPYEPQAYHSLAQTLAELGNADLAIAYYEVALAGQWDGRFGQFHQIVSLDYLHLLRQITAGRLKTSVPDFAKARLDSLAGAAALKQADLVVTIAWNTDGTDVDLHVFEPGGEHCYYQHRSTANGGRLTPDVTQGRGPEMYVLPHAPAGAYAIKANYFSSDANRASTRSTVSATIYQNWGTKHEKVTRKTVTLTKGKEMHEIATVNVEE